MCEWERAQAVIDSWYPNQHTMPGFMARWNVCMLRASHEIKQVKCLKENEAAATRQKASRWESYLLLFFLVHGWMLRILFDYCDVSDSHFVRSVSFWAHTRTALAPPPPEAAAATERRLKKHTECSGRKWNMLCCQFLMLHWILLWVNNY